MFAIFELGMVCRNYLVLTEAVRDGARVAAVSRAASDPSSATVSAVLNAGSDIGLTTANVSVPPATSWQPGGDVTVTATYPYTLKLFGFAIKSGNLSSSTTVRVE